MCEWSFFTGYAHEVIAAYHKRSFGRLARRPRVDWQGCNDRVAASDLDAVQVVAHQLRAAQKLFDESKENLDNPVLSLTRAMISAGTSNRFVAIRRRSSPQTASFCRYQA
jgi:hypothetical protein